MQNITVDSRTFCFDDSWLIMKYDETPFYKNHLKNEKGWKKSMKGVDLIAFDPTYKNLFLIESKDYRKHRRKKKISPEEEFFGKVIDTFTGILPTFLCSNGNTAGENILHQSVANAKKIRLVYQFEQPKKHSKLFPRVFDTADMQIKLRQELRIFDPHLLVIDSTTQSKVAWNVI